MRNSLLAAFAALATSIAVAQTAKPPSIDAVVGHYRFQSGLVMSVERTGDAVTVSSTGNPPQSLSITPDGKFAYASIPGYLTFDLDAAGKAKTLHFHYDEQS